MRNWQRMMCAAGAAGMLAGGAQAAYDLQITEIWPGNEPGNNLSDDWFEITNVGDMAWTAATDGDLYFDDVSAATADADLMGGIESIAAGESVVYVDAGATEIDAAAGLAEWITLWNPVLSSLPQVGYYNGAGLGQGGDGVAIWISSAAPTGTADLFETFPDAELNGGQSYDVLLSAFSTVGNASGAVATTTLNTIDGEAGQPAIGSPGTIPEPGSLALLGLGGLALIARRRRA